MYENYLRENDKHELYVIPMKLLDNLSGVSAGQILKPENNAEGSREVFSEIAWKGFLMSGSKEQRRTTKLYFGTPMTAT